MKNKLFFLLILLYTTQIAYAQYSIRTAGETSGIVKTDRYTGFNLGFEFTKAEAQFSYGLQKEDTHVIFQMNDGRVIRVTPNDPGPDPKDVFKELGKISVYKSYNFKINTPVEENTSTLLTDGKFNPGIGLTVEHIWNNNQLNDASNYIFIRGTYEVKQNKFGRIDNTDTIRVDKHTSQSVGLTPGVNFFLENDWQNDIILAASLPIRYNINPVDDLKSKDFTTDYIAKKNGVIQKEEKAFQGEQEDYLSITPKLDFAYTPIKVTNQDGVETARFGFLTSVSAKFNAQTSKTKYNFSIGPSVHPKWSTSAVLATIQAEFLDFTDSTDTKDINDIFAVKFFVGIPLIFK
jgi:hypothetical protein